MIDYDNQVCLIARFRGCLSVFPVSFVVPLCSFSGVFSPQGSATVPFFFNAPPRGPPRGPGADGIRESRAGVPAPPMHEGWPDGLVGTQPIKTVGTRHAVKSAADIGLAASLNADAVCLSADTLWLSILCVFAC